MNATSPTNSPTTGVGQTPSDAAVTPFSQVLQEELRLIQKRREGIEGEAHPEERNTTDKKSASAPPERTGALTGTAPTGSGNNTKENREPSEDERLTAVRLKALEEHVTGLSFSGGGIRAGTLAVGFLQGLAALGLVRRFDYLSTVSGGGYAGAWLVAWLRRQGGDPRNVEQRLSPSRVDQARAERMYLRVGEVVDEEPQPLRHLRSYSSYLFPTPGILSTDTWTVILIWARNVTINLLLLLPLTMMAVVAARFFVWLYGALNPVRLSDREGFLLWAILPGILGLMILAFVICENALALREFRKGDPKLRLVKDTRHADRSVRRRIIYPAGVAALLVTFSVRGIIWWLGEVVESSESAADGASGQAIFPAIRAALDPYFGHLSWLIGIGHAVAGGVVGAIFAWRAYEARRVNRLADGRKLIASLSKGFSVGAIVSLGLLALELLFRYALWDYITGHLGLLDPPNFALHMLLVFGPIAALAAWSLAPRDNPQPGKIGFAAYVAGMASGGLLVLLERLLKQFAIWERPDLMAEFAPPAALLIGVVGLIVEIGLLGRAVSEAEREWSARIAAMLTRFALFWLAGVGIILYVPGLFLYSGTFVRTLIASGWLGSAAFGVGAGHYVLPRLGKSAGLTLTQIAAVASVVFLAGLLGAVALLGSLLTNTPALYNPADADIGHFSYYLMGVNGTTFPWLALVFAVAASLYFIATRLIEVNLFSLNAMYANRLTRCYVGASRPVSAWPTRWNPPWDQRVKVGAPSISQGNPAPPDRNPNPVTEFDSKDDLDLRSLRIGKPQFPQEGEVTRGPYLGPHLLINTTLNLVGGDDLAWRSRKGESFTLSPLYCGAKTVGYSKLEYGDDEANRPNPDPNMTLGRAIAISGAAVDPNMSFYQSAALTALLTIFNARLGFWIEKPHAHGWSAKSPACHDFDLFLTEFFGRTDDQGKFVHISDGGHFDNLGVYELVRRRCRYIVALDAADDWDASDDNLANLIRLCRIDFGVRIQLDTAPLKPEGPDRLTRTHVVMGRIRYDDVDQGQLPGVLVYVKSSLTGDEPPDLQKYARKDERFPHQPTDLRQSFDEEEFECYRCLGDHIARRVFADAVHQSKDEEADPAAFPHKHKEFARRLFARLQNRWAEPPEGQSEQFLELSASWSRLQRDLGSRPELARLSRDLYPELPQVAPSGNGKPGSAPDDGDPAAAREDSANEPKKPRGSPSPSPSPAAAPTVADRAEVHAVCRMLQMMEDAWISLGLKRYSALPMNRGWLNSFRRWTSTAAFQRLWPTLRSEYGSDFVEFCEAQLNRTTATPSLVPLTTKSADLNDFDKAAFEMLAQEFAREWPKESLNDRGLEQRLQSAIDFRSSTAPVTAHLIVQATSKYKSASAAPPPERVVSGIILLARFADSPVQPTHRSYVENPIELFVWVRPPHRSAGLASKCLTRELMERFHTATEGKPLWVRYPDPAPHDDDIEFSNWVNFFAGHDFKRVVQDPERDKHWHCALLKLDWPRR
jgi:hypothetical protein